MSIKQKKGNISKVLTSLNFSVKLLQQTFLENNKRGHLIPSTCRKVKMLFFWCFHPNSAAPSISNDESQYLQRLKNLMFDFNYVKIYFAKLFSSQSC